MKKRSVLSIQSVIALLVTLFTVDRLWKLVVITHFFRRQPPAPPVTVPTITLLQPVTRGASALTENLHARALLQYEGKIQHLLICDHEDQKTQAICKRFLADHPDLDAQIILAEAKSTALASKIEKFTAALPHATGEVLCFIDDDIAPRPNALSLLIPPLFQAEVGAVFGLACYTSWETPWSSLMSLFVNANALLSYIPLTYLTDPFTVTGHCFALTRQTLEQIGSFEGLDARIDDDHELARRVRALGLRCIQTSMIYDVTNELPTLQAYNRQMKRWFILPRQTLLPFLTKQEQAFSFFCSAGNLIPSLLLLLILISRKRSALSGTVLCLALFLAAYEYCELCYLKRHTPWRRWLLFPVVIFILPLQVVQSFFSDNVIEWRGQRLYIERGGRMHVVK